MHLLRWTMFCACAVAAMAQTHNVTRRESGSESGKRVVCYYTNWSVYRPGTAKFSPQNINPYLCTHLIYAFGGLTRENSLRPYDKYQDIEQGGYAKFTGLKTYNKNLKTMLAIGGWNEGSARFSTLVADDERRTEMVRNVIKFLRQNHFDGLDLDWEYPAFRDGGKSWDRENYALFVQELRSEFDRESQKTGRPRLLLTMAVPAGIEYIDKGYDIPKLNRYLDFMNILSYDYHSAFEPAVNHHSPLYPLEEDSEYNFDTQLSIDYTIGHYLKLGADRDKLVLGIPTYGRSYTLFNPLATEIGAPSDGPGEQGDATREKGYLAYYEICDSLKADEWKVEHPNPSAMGPYAFKGNQWVGYDDIDIVRLKSRYVSENGLGGIMFWSIDNDDFRGKCHGRPYPLIEAGKEALLAASASNDVVSVAPSRGSTKTRPKRPPSSGSTVSGSGSGRQGPQGGQRPHKKRPSNRRHHDKPVRSTTATTTTTSTTPKYNYPQTTPEPPTTPDPGSDFMCKDEGFFPHPRDCKKYFWCLDSGPSNLGIVAHQFTCPSGLFFNKGADSCDYARNVVCKKKPSTSTTTTKAPPVTSTARTTTRLIPPTTRTTTTTTTTTPEPLLDEEEYDDEEYDDEVDEPQEDPQVIKELVNLIKKLGGVEQLEKHLYLQEADKDTKSGQVTTSGFSRSLYDRVLSRANNNNFNNRPISGDSSTTPRYSSVYRNRPVKPQNEGLDGLEEVKSLRWEKPQYVTIKRDRPSTPIPEEDEEEEEEEAEEEEGYQVPVNDEANRGDYGKSQGGGAVEYVNIRRARPSTPADDSTTPRYITIQRSRKPSTEPEVDDTDLEVTTEIRPVFVGSTEREPEPKIQIVTPSRSLVTEKVYRKFHRADVQEATTTPEPQVSAERPQYVDITSFRRHDYAPEESTSPLSLPEENVPYVEVNTVNRRRNALHDNDIPDVPPPPPPPFPILDEVFTDDSPRYVDSVGNGRIRGYTTENSTPEDVSVSSTASPEEGTHPKLIEILSRRRGTTSATTETPTTTTEKRKYNPRRRGTTPFPTTITPFPETEPQITDVETTVQTQSAPTTTPGIETTPPQTVPETLPPPTSTKFTPTVTRIITSVTESGTTERQKIAINRVPYIAIAALRGETIYPGPLVQNRATVPIGKRLLRPTTPQTTAFQSETTTASTEQNTFPVTIPTEHKFEKVMEVNMIKLVTLKEELPVGFTQALPGNETTEKILVDVQSERTVDKISEVNRFKYVTVVDNSQTAVPPSESTTESLGETLHTPETPVSENINVQNIAVTEKQQDIAITETTDTQVTETLAVTKPTTSKQISPSVATTLEEISYTTELPSSPVTPIGNRRRQGDVRKPGVDDFKRRRTRPTFSRSTTEVAPSSTQSTFSQRRRGQRIRPRPHRPTSTTGADDEAPAISISDDAIIPEDKNEEQRKTFVPKRGQRKRPRPNGPTTEGVTPDVNDNSLVNSERTTETSRFSPKRNNRRRISTTKSLPEIPTTEKEVTVPTTVTEIKELAELLTTMTTESITTLKPFEIDEQSSTESAKSLTSSFELVSENNDGISRTSEDVVSSTNIDVNDVKTTEILETTEPSISNSISTEPETKLDFTNTVSEIVLTTEVPTKANEIFRRSTLRPSFRRTTAETTSTGKTKSTIVPTTENSNSRGEKLRIKKRRRRPFTRSTGAPSSTSSTTETITVSTEGTTPQFSLNEIRLDHADSDKDLFETPVTSFPTDALLERENYDITTLSPNGGFATTVDREGKHVLKISLLNDANDKAAVQKPQKNSADNKTSVKNNVNDVETASENLKFTTYDDSDLETDNSDYVTGTGGGNLIQTIGASIKATSELVHDKDTVEVEDVPNKGKGFTRKGFKNSTKSTEKYYFNASVDFTTDSSSSSTTKQPASGRRGTYRTTSSDGNGRRLLRRKRPSSTTAEPPSEVVTTTTTRSLRRPTASLFNANRTRQRLTTVATTTTTTEIPSTSEASALRRKPGTRIIKRRKYGGPVNRTRTDSDATASEIEPSEAPSDKEAPAPRVRKLTFARRRPTTTPVPITTTPPPVEEKGELQLLESKDNQATEAEEDELDISVTTKLPDLANSAVAAIHNLATAPPSSQSNREVVTTTHVDTEVPQTLPIISSTPSTAALLPRRGSTIFVREQTSPAPPLPPPRRGSTLYVVQPTASPAPVSPRRLPGSATLRPRPFSKTPSTVTTAVTSPRPKTSRPKKPPIVDYEYYDDDDLGILDVAPVSGKVKIHSDGYIQCLDRGNFPHPFSCKKFISCAKMENGDLLGWEYTCPRQLSFDPIGGICNWSAGLGCKE